MIATDQGRWFDPDAADVYNDHQYVQNGKLISSETRSHSEHERLFITKKGNAIIERTFDDPGLWTLYLESNRDRAITWLIRNKQEKAIEKHWPGVLEEEQL